MIQRSLAPIASYNYLLDCLEVQGYIQSYPCNPVTSILQNQKDIIIALELLIFRQKIQQKLHFRCWCSVLHIFQRRHYNLHCRSKTNTVLNSNSNIKTTSQTSRTTFTSISFIPKTLSNPVVTLCPAHHPISIIAFPVYLITRTLSN